MKVIEIELTEETYESLLREAEEKATTVEAIPRERVEPKNPGRSLRWIWGRFPLPARKMA